MSADSITSVDHSNLLSPSSQPADEGGGTEAEKDSSSVRSRSNEAEEFLETHEVIELQAFIERKVWIDEKIQVCTCFESSCA